MNRDAPLGHCAVGLRQLRGRCPLRARRRKPELPKANEERPSEGPSPKTAETRDRVTENGFRFMDLYDDVVHRLAK